MYPQVHVVGHSLIEPLGAMVAGVLLLISVDLHVAAEVTSVVEELPTFRTPGREFVRPLVDGSIVKKEK